MRGGGGIIFLGVRQFATRFCLVGKFQGLPERSPDVYPEVCPEGIG